MADAPFAQFPGDFESLARQYWNTWNELLGRGGTTDAWGLAGAMPPGLGAMGMGTGTYDWYQRMQRLAADFSGGGNAGDVARAWREMLGGQGADPFAGMLRSMHGGLAGGDWLEQMRPMLDMLLRPLRQQGAEWLQRPAFGPAREHQERLQALALAWQEWEQRNEAFNAVLAQVAQGAHAHFERLLGERDAPGKRLESARALFDLWIDAAEEAWAEIALSDEYRHAYAGMTNALMRLRLGLQREVEQFGTLLGLPGRSEINALHRKVAGLERALHAARRGASAQAPARQAPPTRAARPAAAPPAPATAEAAPAPSRQPAAASHKNGGTPASRKPKAKAPRPVKRTPASKPASARKTAQHAAAVRAVAATAVVKAGGAKAGERKAARRGSAGKVATDRSRSAAPGAATRVATKAPPALTRKAPVKAKGAVRRSAAAGPTTKGRNAAATQRPAPVARTAKAAVQRKAATRAQAQPSAATARKAKATGGNTRPSAAAKAADIAPATAKVVSMKDWVSRNLAAASPAAPAERKPGGKRGGRGR